MNPTIGCPICVSISANNHKRVWRLRRVVDLKVMLCWACDPYYDDNIDVVLKEFIQVKLIIGEICGQREICDVSPHIFSLFVDSHK
jgi:hypothetical protein